MEEVLNNFGLASVVESFQMDLELTSVVEFNLVVPSGSVEDAEGSFVLFIKTAGYVY